MKFQIETITPDIAKQYLTTMPSYQRRKIPSLVSKLSHAMKSGSWMTTHQGIAFNKNGELFDGQNRMLAVVDSNTTIEIAVFRGVDPNAWHATDVGRKRDLEAITGIPKKEVEVYRSVCDFAWRLREPDYADLVRVRDSDIGCKIRELLLYAPTTKRLISAAPVKMVVSLWALKSKTNYAFEQYKALTLSHYNVMSIASQALCRQVEASANGTRKITSYDMAARSYKTFDPSKSDMTKIQISDISGTTSKIGMDLLEIIDPS